jgi:hypothetical protein
MFCYGFNFNFIADLWRQAKKIKKKNSEIMGYEIWLSLEPRQPTT